jgi:hypothetical protein
MTGLRQTAKSRAGMHDPGNSSRFGHLLRAPPAPGTGHNLVAEKFFKKIF